MIKLNNRIVQKNLYVILNNKVYMGASANGYKLIIEFSEINILSYQYGNYNDLLMDFREINNIKKLLNERTK
jgi:hypothetical protein